MKWFNYVVTFLFFLNAKNLGRSDDNKRRKEKSMASECVDSSRLQLSLSQAPTVNLSRWRSSKMRNFPELFGTFPTKRGPKIPTSISRKKVFQGDNRRNMQSEQICMYTATKEIAERKTWKKSGFQPINPKRSRLRDASYLIQSSSSSCRSVRVANISLITWEGV